MKNVSTLSFIPPLFLAWVSFRTLLLINISPHYIFICSVLHLFRPYFCSTDMVATGASYAIGQQSSIDTLVGNCHYFFFDRQKCRNWLLTALYRPGLLLSLQKCDVNLPVRQLRFSLTFTLCQRLMPNRDNATKFCNHLNWLNRGQYAAGFMIGWDGSLVCQYDHHVTVSLWLHDFASFPAMRNLGSKILNRLCPGGGLLCSYLLLHVIASDTIL